MLPYKCAVYNSKKIKFIKKEAEGVKISRTGKIMFSPLAILGSFGLM